MLAHRGKYTEGGREGGREEKVTNINTQMGR